MIIHQLVIRSELKILKEKEVLFFNDDRSAIVINGELYMLTFSEDIDNPQVIATFTAGDIVGNKSLDQGMTTHTHSWIVAY